MYNREISIGKGLVAYKYKYFLDKNHLLASKPDGIVLLHRHLMSLKLGRWILPTEHVHHIDGNSQNNDDSNLEILSKEEHARKHSIEGRVHWQQPCKYCSKLLLFTDCTSSTKQYCSIKCKALDSVKDKALTKEVLEDLLPFHTWTSLGYLLNYTDNGIKKRAKSLGCDLSLIRTKM